MFIIFCSDHSVLGSRSTINKQTINNLAVELSVCCFLCVVFVFAFLLSVVLGMHTVDVKKLKPKLPRSEPRARMMRTLRF